MKKILRADEPRAVHQFTSFDQVSQLVAASESDPDLGYYGANDAAVQPAPQ